MAGAIAQTGFEARKRRRIGAIVAVSALAHLIVLALVGFSAPKLIFKPMPSEQAIEVWLTSDLTPQTRTPKARAAPVRAPSRTLPTVRPAQPAAPPTPRPAPAPPQKAPAVVAAPQAPAAASGAPTGRASAPATVEGEAGGSAEQALRTSVGCDYEHMVHLSPAERDKCSQSIGATARRAPAFSGIDPLKRGRFDEQVAADERKRAARTGPLGQPVESCGAFGCLPDSAVGHWKIPSPNN